MDKEINPIGMCYTWGGEEPCGFRCQDRRHHLYVTVTAEEGDAYRIITGHRRYRAAKAAGLEKIEILIREPEDDRRRSRSGPTGESGNASNQGRMQRILLRWKSALAVSSAALRPYCFRAKSNPFSPGPSRWFIRVRNS